MSRGLWRSSRARRLDDAAVPRDIAAPWQNRHEPLLARQGPSDTLSGVIPTVEPTTTTTNPTTTTSESPPPTTDTTPTSTRTTTPPAPPTSTTATVPTISTPLPSVSLPSGSTLTLTRTVTSVGNTNPTDIPDTDVNTSKGGFWSNKAAVGGVFGAVGLVGLIILFLFASNALRRSRARKFDREISEAAATGHGGYRDEDDEQPTFPFQNKPNETYDMPEFNGPYGHPYAAPGVVAAGTAGVGAAGYHNDHYAQGGYDQYSAAHQSYGYTESVSSYPSTYYTGQQQPGYPGQQAPYPSVGQSSSPPPPREFASPPPRHMTPMAAYSGAPSIDAYGGMAGMGAYGSTSGSQPPPVAYGGAERGAYAHMQRQDQLNRALSTRSSAPTYVSQQPPSSGHEGMAGIVAAAGLGGAAAHVPLRDEKVPLPPIPPSPTPAAAPRLSGEHDAGNKSEGELPNPFRSRASGESISGEEWDDEESAGHNAPRVLKVANQ